MTDTQYARWKNFSMRMAIRGFGLRLKKSRRDLAWFVKDFFRTLDREYFTVNETLPVAYDPKWRMDMNQGRRANEFLRDRVHDWDHTDSHPTWQDRYGHSTNGPYICDIVSMQMEHWNPYYWRDERKAKRWDELWGDRITACLRAGMDMAVSPSMGVLGFTAGDIRRMYRGNVPDWLFGDEPVEVQHFDGVIPGVGLIPGRRDTNGTFASLPDSASMWL